MVVCVPQVSKNKCAPPYKLAEFDIMCAQTPKKEPNIKSKGKVVAPFPDGALCMPGRQQQSL